MMMTSPIQTLPDVLERMKRVPTDRHYLSVLLDTTPERMIGQAYRVSFRDAIRSLREELAETDPAEKTQFEQAVGVADAYVNDQVSAQAAGLAIYLDSTGEIEVAVPLPMSPPNHVEWAAYPDIEPLVEALDEQERMAVVLIDKERTRLFTIFLGQVEEQTAFRDEVVGKQATGDWFALSQKRYARHHDVEVMRHVKRTIHAMMEELRLRPFDRLLIGGAPEAVTVLTHQLPSPLRDRLAGTLHLELFVTDAEVVEAAMREAGIARQRQDLEQVRQILDASTGQNAAVGPDATLAVLSEARVHRLFVTRELALAGGECPVCDRLMLQEGDCPVCGNHLTPVSSIRERSIANALGQGARVEIVIGDAADLLMAHGGMAAWTRY